MKIITMKRLTMDGEPLDPDYDEDPNDWWCVIETPEEEIVYDKYLEYPDKHEFLWNAMVKHAGQDEGVSWGDDDIYGYIKPDEHVPKVKENFKDGEGDIWVRVN